MSERRWFLAVPAVWVRGEQPPQERVQEPAEQPIEEPAEEIGEVHLLHNGAPVTSAAELLAKLDEPVLKRDKKTYSRDVSCVSVKW
jgi:hypothetical protein